MKTFFYLVLMVGLISTAWGSTAIELTDNSVDHPGHCFGKSKNVGAMEKGESKTLKGECVNAICSDSTNIYYYSCGAIIPPENCKLSEVDLSKPYPDCCPQVDCS